MLRFAVFVFVVASSAATLLLSFQSQEARGAYSANPCRENHRNELVCQSMRHLRRQVFLLQAQRDLMQVNYEWVASIGVEIQQNLDFLIENVGDQLEKDTELPVEVLRLIQKEAGDMARLANERNFSALGLANNIHRKCAACHSKREPRSDYDWNQVFREGWDHIVDRCNNPPRGVSRRVPYRCKSMNGMLSVFDYLETSVLLEDAYERLESSRGIESVWQPNYHTILNAGRELGRIASDLQIKAAFPDVKQGEKHVGDVLQVSAQLENLAQTLIDQGYEDAEAKAQLRELMQGGTEACMRCHGIH